jgi:type I restriction enzyme R subunit
LFKTFNQHLAAAKVQGLHWDQLTYTFGENDEEHVVELAITEQTFLSLALRYKELAGKGEGSGEGGGGDVPFDISGYLTEIDTGKIDADYMNSRFDKFLKELNQNQDQASIENTLNELHKSFASLTQNEQKYAKLFLHDLQRGDAQLIAGHSFRDYINDYKNKAENAQINAVVNALGLDKNKLMALMADKVNEKNLNNFGRFDALKETVNKEQAKAYFEKLEGASIPPFKLNMRIDKFLKQFVFAQQADSEFFHELDDVIDDTKSATPVPLVFGDENIY